MTISGGPSTGPTFYKYSWQATPTHKPPACGLAWLTNIAKAHGVSRGIDSGGHEMGNTLTKYTVRVWCENEDVMDSVQVAAEFDSEVFEIAEEIHNGECESYFQCASEGWDFMEGWE